MSASLVGSEMCIRDRKDHGYFERPGDSGATKVPIGPMDKARLLQFPVSYTHLTLPTICSV
eukprot:8203805-Alexandrium_andersonii.AAC.1